VGGRICCGYERARAGTSAHGACGHSREWQGWVRLREGRVLPAARPKPRRGVHRSCAGRGGLRVEAARPGRAGPPGGTVGQLVPVHAHRGATVRSGAAGGRARGHRGADVGDLAGSAWSCACALAALVGLAGAGGGEHGLAVRALCVGDAVDCGEFCGGHQRHRAAVCGTDRMAVAEGQTVARRERGARGRFPGRGGAGVAEAERCRRRVDLGGRGLLWRDAELWMVG